MGHLPTPVIVGTCCYNWLFQWDEIHSINGVVLVLITDNPIYRTDNTTVTDNPIYSTNGVVVPITVIPFYVINGHNCNC